MTQINLREVRQKYKMTKPEFAKHLGVCVTRYALYENPDKKIDLPEHRLELLKYKIKEWDNNLCQCGRVLIK
jgi:DNA-binding transcriptional regulator YiaG